MAVFEIPVKQYTSAIDSSLNLMLFIHKVACEKTVLWSQKKD